MRAALFAIAPLALCAAACAAISRPTPATPLPAAARDSPEHFVVVTVHNDRTGRRALEPGTKGGYRGTAAYAVSREARAMSRSLALDYRLHETASWPIPLLGVDCIVYELPATGDQASLLARLGRDRRVDSVQPLATFATQAAPYNDPYAGLQTSLAQMGVPEAQQWSRGEAVRVAVVDTGVDSRHPDLHGRIVQERNFVDRDADAFHGDRHGTAVAGVIAAVANNHIGIAGIAPAVQLFAYKSCWQQPSGHGGAVCNTFTLAQGLAAAVSARADIVNLSLAGPPDALLARIVESGQRRGVIFVGAAPPAGAAAGFPGDVPGVVMVDAPGRSSGSAATLVAPGNDVLTLVPGAHYDFSSGSSFAAAQVSAVAALLLARERGMSAAELQRLLVETSKPARLASGPYHLVNACAAMVALQHQGSCPPDPAGDASIEASPLREAARGPD